MQLRWEKRLQKKSFRVSLLVVLLAIGFVLRFYNIEWGEPYFFHPDERNIASTVSRLHFPDQLKPRMYAYGTFPMYINILLQQVMGTLGFSFGNPFSQSVLVGRLLSVYASTALIVVVYFIGKELVSKKVGLLSSFLVTISVGLIQAAHYATFESILALEYALVLLVSISLARHNRLRDWLILGFISGLAVGTKITSLLILGVYPVLVFLLARQKKINLVRVLTHALFSLIVGLIIFFVTNPYVVLDYSSFSSSMNYEGGVARGKLPVFYTRQFFDIGAIEFYMTRVFPWVLGLPLTILLPIALVYSLWLLMKDSRFLLLFAVFLPSLFFNFFLFVKWSRYMVPLLPLLLILMSSLIVRVYEKEGSKWVKSLRRITMFIVVGFTILWMMSFMKIYTKDDARVTAALWAENNIPQNAEILSEIYELGILPFNDWFQENITLFDFYGLDPNPENKIDLLAQHLEKVDFIILPSRRIWGTALSNSHRFPNVNLFYTKLFDESLGFSKVYESSSYPRLLGFEFSDDMAEETFQVFDHPKVLIYQKARSFSTNEYLALLKKPL